MKGIGINKMTRKTPEDKKELNITGEHPNILFCITTGLFCKLYMNYFSDDEKQNEFSFPNFHDHEATSSYIQAFDLFYHSYCSRRYGLEAY